MRLLRVMFILALTLPLLGSSCSRTRVSEDNARKAHGYFEMGVASMQGGDSTGALGDLQKAVALNPYDAEIYNAIGLCYYSKHKFGKATSNFQKALELDPTHSDAHHNLGHLYLTQGRFDLAIGEFEKALTNDLYRERAQTLNAVGYAYYKKRDYLKAEKALRECVDHDRLYFLAYGNLGKVYIALDRYADAKSILERALEIKPVYPEAMLDLSLVYIKLGDKQRAYTLVKRVKQIDPYGEFGARADEILNLIE